jgi:hypothetical protein
MASYQPVSSTTYNASIKITTSNTMITQTMVQPSSWVATGILMAKVRDRYLFKFSDELQERLDALNQQKKTAALTEGENAELEGILELDRIFTLLNAKVIAEA